jgi:cellulose synthase/poly-beta-1,6-N-acetylglucosamine synthase-like glycosyltransferase
MLTVLLALIALPPALLTALFAAELVLGLAPLPRRPTAAPGTKAAVIVPAHDEGKVIGSTVAHLLAAAPANVRLIVVADNCTDDTAELARRAGAEVIVRTDAVHRGKGYALDFAAGHLEQDPPDVVAVVDADCTLDAASLEALVSECAAKGAPVQAINLLRPDRTGPPMVQLSTFGFMLKNLLRQRGLQRIAGRVHLTGTGMAIPFRLFRAAPLASGNVVEDLELGLHFAAQGCAPSLSEAAQIWSASSTESGTLTQRRRWEGGYLATALRVAPRLLLRSVLRLDWKGVASALDLMIPPLALLAVLDFAALLGGLLLWLAGASLWPLVVLLLSLAAAALATALAWHREGRRFIALKVLARLPLYVLWKLPLYLGMGRRGAPTDWLRTGR